MYPIIHLLSLIFLLGCSSTTNPTPDRDLYELKGDVYQLTEVQYPAVYDEENGWQTTGPSLLVRTQKISFTSEGFYSLREQYEGDILSMRTEVQFVDSLPVSWVSTNGDNEEIGTGKYQLHSQRELLTESFDVDGQLSFRIHHNIKRGRAEEELISFFGDDGTEKFSGRVESTYDRQGRLVERRQYQDGELASVNKIEHTDFDEQGNWTRRVEMDQSEGAERLLPQRGTIVERELVYY